MAAEIGEYSYDRLLNLTVRYNRRIQNDKLARLPFLDNATGIAQRPCFLYRHNREQCTGFLTHLYQYPPQKWKKAKRSTIPISNTNCSSEFWNGTLKMSTVNSQDASSRDLEDEDSRSTWVAGPDYDIDSDTSDIIDETYGNRQKRRKPRLSRSTRSLAGGAGSSRRRLGGAGQQQQHHQQYPSYSYFDEDSNDRPSTAATHMFVCEVCGVRYRSRTGLNYHFNSQHPNANRTGSGRIMVTGTPDPLSNHNHHHTNGALHSPAAAHHGVNYSSGGEPNNTLSTSHNDSGGKSRTRQSSTIIADTTSRRIGDPHNNWRTDSATVDKSTCDFCLGDVRENKKTGLAEEMLRCSDCSRCAHFSCLQFTSNMITSIRTYRWQCIECKTCWLCGTSENDEQMLFCDDCDRGYHMYCLDPPLTEPPEGSWSCKLCVDHFRDSAASFKSFPLGPTGGERLAVPTKSVYLERTKDPGAATPSVAASLLPCVNNSTSNSNNNSHFSSSSSSSGT